MLEHRPQFVGRPAVCPVAACLKVIEQEDWPVWLGEHEGYAAPLLQPAAVDMLATKGAGGEMAEVFRNPTQCGCPPLGFQIRADVSSLITGSDHGEDKASLRLIRRVARHRREASGLPFTPTSLALTKAGSP
jgi:hypothetical protein